jgi:epoxide hydrolase-like predicted phosphatase
MIKAIIFDCFGVLYLDAHESFAAEFPLVAQELRDINRQADYGMLGRDEYVSAVAQLTGATPESVESFVNGEHRLNEQLMDFIQSDLKTDYKIGLLSNIGREWINDFFDTHQLHDLFNAVVLSGEEGVTKPHPRIYEIMVERLGVEPHECVMIDDIADNCAGADAAGMKAIHYLSNRQMFAELKKMLAN